MVSGEERSPQDRPLPPLDARWTGSTCANEEPASDALYRGRARRTPRSGPVITTTGRPGAAVAKQDLRRSFIRT